MDVWVARSPDDQSWWTLPIRGKAELTPAGLGLSDPYHTRFDVLYDRFLTFAELQQLPTDPAALEAYILAIPPHHPDLPVVPVSDRLFDACIALAETPAPPDVRAAAFRLLAGLPDLTALGQVTDALGRPGVGVSNSDFDGEEMIIDPSTGTLLALENFANVGGKMEMTDYQATVVAAWTDTVQPPAPIAS